jgi:hypothetical protein
MIITPSETLIKKEEKVHKKTWLNEARLLYFLRRQAAKPN